NLYAFYVGITGRDPADIEASAWRWEDGLGGGRGRVEHMETLTATDRARYGDLTRRTFLQVRSAVEGYR
ncbi:MAG: hypothetical protein MUE69_34500, partial [Myxococcota bacterium]|nr:hypothetical protein [Myxococcota bacterium]